jgi:hypothetical protein
LSFTTGLATLILAINQINWKWVSKKTILKKKEFL